MKFVLGSYNVGLGHIIDAQRLAEKHQHNPNEWDDNVSYFLEQKSKPTYYTDSVVKHGYCRGSEPTRYVREVLARYEHYKNVIN